MNEREVLPVSRKDFSCSERYFVVVLMRVRLWSPVFFICAYRLNTAEHSKRQMGRKMDRLNECSPFFYPFDAYVITLHRFRADVVDYRDALRVRKLEAPGKDRAACAALRDGHVRAFAARLVDRQRNIFRLTVGQRSIPRRVIGDPALGVGEELFG